MSGGQPRLRSTWSSKRPDRGWRRAGHRESASASRAVRKHEKDLAMEKLTGTACDAVPVDRSGSAIATLSTCVSPTAAGRSFRIAVSFTRAPMEFEASFGSILTSDPSGTDFRSRWSRRRSCSKSGCPTFILKAVHPRLAACENSAQHPHCSGENRDCSHKRKPGPASQRAPLSPRVATLPPFRPLRAVPLLRSEPGSG